MSVLVATLAAVVVLLLMGGHPSLGQHEPLAPVPGREDRATLVRLRPLLALMGAAGGWAMVGGTLGMMVAGACGAAVWVVLGRTEAPAVVRRREELVEDLPIAVGLLGSCLEAGAAPEAALVSDSKALGGPVGDELLAMQHRLELGVDPAQVWRAVAAHPQLSPLGRAVGRAHDTGAPIGIAVHQLAEELRDQARAEVETRARSIEVKAAAPLGLCLLPAFVVLGVVPMVVGVFSVMQLFQ